VNVTCFPPRIARWNRRNVVLWPLRTISKAFSRLRRSGYIWKSLSKLAARMPRRSMKAKLVQSMDGLLATALPV
jgi:hypothetical protein